MALALLRKIPCKIPLQLAAPTIILQQQVAGIMSKAMRPKDYKRIAPFDYLNKNYENTLHLVFDKTTKRMDDNSRLIVVDGPVAAGKTAVVNYLAEELDMLAVPHANLDMKYINDYGHDLREINHRLNDNIKCFDTNDWLQDPSHWLSTRHQLDLYEIRVEQYFNALNHLLNTGQGVVMDRSLLSNFIFLETCVKHGMINKNMNEYNRESLSYVLPMILHPHVLIYLDVPADVCLERIKKRNYPAEKNSPFYTKEIFNEIEYKYKQEYLKEYEPYCETLFYDWSSDNCDPQTIVEDLELIDFDSYRRRDKKCSDWRVCIHNKAWAQKRMLFGWHKQSTIEDIRVCRTDIPELWVTEDDRQTMLVATEDCRGREFALGYNTKDGDPPSQLYFKHFKKQFMTSEYVGSM